MLLNPHHFTHDLMGEQRPRHYENSRNSCFLGGDLLTGLTTFHVKASVDEDAKLANAMPRVGKVLDAVEELSKKQASVQAIGKRLRSDCYDRNGEPVFG
jgi:pyridoxal/pyridoxine/pyridoxamine kinase